MATTQAGMIGHAPTVLIQPNKAKKAETKQELYKDKCWELDSYRNHSPGEHLAKMFLETCEPKTGVTVIDWGCGTGRGGHSIHEARPDLDIVFVDFADNCLDEGIQAVDEETGAPLFDADGSIVYRPDRPNIREAIEKSDSMRFVVEDLTEPSEEASLFGFCTDVMEHIDEEDVDKVLSNILWSSQNVFFQISTQPSGFSHHHDINEELHVCQHDYHWWLRKFCDQAVHVNRSMEIGGSVLFYVTGWGCKELDFTGGTVNTSEEEILDNIRENSKLKLKEMSPHGVDPDVEVMLLCGGPTLNDFEYEIIKKRSQGVKLITTNGSYNWAISKGLEPSLQCIVDAREFNKRFTEQCELTKNTQYAISSQCNPAIFKGMPLDRTHVWHVTLSDDGIETITENYGEQYKDWWPVPGGSTVGMRTLCLLQMLGFRKIYVYGLDSCIFEDRDHHAYEQEENDAVQGIIPIVVGGGTQYEKTFQCQPWQAFQSKEFEAMVPRMAEVSDLQIQIKGDGLIAYMVETQAKVLEDEVREKTT